MPLRGGTGNVVEAYKKTRLSPFSFVVFIASRYSLIVQVFSLQRLESSSPEFLSFCTADRCNISQMYHTTAVIKSVSLLAAVASEVTLALPQSGGIPAFPPVKCPKITSQKNVNGARCQ